MTYQLWDMASRNLIDEFEDEAEALGTVRAYLTPDEDGLTVEVALVIYDERPEPRRSVHGDELAAWAFGSVPGEARQSA